VAKTPTKFQSDIAEIGHSLVLRATQNEQALMLFRKGEVLFGGCPLLVGPKEDLALSVICASDDVLRHIWDVHKDNCPEHQGDNHSDLIVV